MKTQTAAHTPGKWHVNGFAYHETTGTVTGRTLRAHNIDADCDKYTVNFANGEICQMKGGKHNRANAALIASTPDLLAALQAVHAGFMDGSIKWAKPRQADTDPYHPANVLMSAALASVGEKT